MEERPETKVLMALVALKKASKELEINPVVGTKDPAVESPSMKALLALETGSDDLLSGDPNLSTLSQLLSHLKSLASSLRSGTGGKGFLRTLLRRRSQGEDEISRVAGSIGSEIQLWIDRTSVDRLISTLRSPDKDEEEAAESLAALEARVSQGFDRGLQEVLLRSGAFAAVEASLADASSSKRVREGAAKAVLALVRFNKAVFVGPMLMGPTVKTLISIGSAATIRVLGGLVASIKSPLVDVLFEDGEFHRLIPPLSSPDLEICLAALDCCLDIGYVARKEAVEAMMEEGLVKRLMELQRWWEHAGGEGEGVAAGGVRRRRRKEEGRRLGSCVARFAVQVEVGEGMRQREKNAVKMEVLRRVREAAVTAAEGATVVAEVLWGGTP